MSRKKIDPFSICTITINGTIEYSQCFVLSFNKSISLVKMTPVG